MIVSSNVSLMKSFHYICKPFQYTSCYIWLSASHRVSTLQKGTRRLWGREGCAGDDGKTERPYQTTRPTGQEIGLCGEERDLESIIRFWTLSLSLSGLSLLKQKTLGFWFRHVVSTVEFYFQMGHNLLYRLFTWKSRSYVGLLFFFITS